MSQWNYENQKVNTTPVILKMCLIRSQHRQETFNAVYLEQEKLVGFRRTGTHKTLI